MQTKEHAAEIRKALKSKGITSKQVSVRTSLYSMGSSIRATVKDPGIEIETVREIAESHQRVRYCEASGEILSGGNMFVFVDYSSDAENTRAEKFREPVEAAAALHRENGGPSSVLLPIEGSGHMLGYTAGERWSLWREGNEDISGTHIQDCWDLDGVMRMLGHQPKMVAA